MKRLFLSLSLVTLLTSCKSASDPMMVTRLLVEEPQPKTVKIKIKQSNGKWEPEAFEKTVKGKAKVNYLRWEFDGPSTATYRIDFRNAEQKTTCVGSVCESDLLVFPHESYTPDPDQPANANRRRIEYDIYMTVDGAPQEIDPWVVIEK